MLTGAIIGFVVAVVMIVINKSKARSGTGLPGQVEAAMQGAGPLTLAQVAAKVGKDSFLGRGKVAQALGALQSIGKIRMNPAPAGTPQLKKVDVITYELAGGPPPS
jgi:hypothetical protein